MSYVMTDEMKKRCPNMWKYIQKYGSDNLPCTFFMPPRFRDNVDDFYEWCLDEGKEWDELIHIDKNAIY